MVATLVAHRADFTALNAEGQRALRNFDFAET
jgi:hypothetical protein